MKQLLITIAALVLVGCSDPEAEANKLFTEASQLVKEADAIKEPNSLKAFNKRKAAIESLEKIPVQYPQSSLSVKISEGDFQIQNQSIDEIRGKMKPDISIYGAAYGGNIEAVKQHLAAGTDVNAKGYNKMTPLRVAIQKKHTEIVKLLIAKGADVNAETYLEDAIKGENTEILELLIANGANVNAPHGLSALHIAAREGHKEIVELLIAKGADVNAKGYGGGTPLDMAILFDHTEIADLLRKHGGKTKKELEAAGN